MAHAPIPTVPWGDNGVGIDRGRGGAGESKEGKLGPL